MPSKNKYTFGFSSCPNDTFQFEAIVNNKINLQGLEFDFHIADVEELNKMALEGEIDITKISFGTFLKLTSKYILFDSGSALGKQNGPLIISNKAIEMQNIQELTIAIPGYNTTANLLLNIIYPQITKKNEYLFSDIERAVLGNVVDLGLIIHENRFTYAERGLIKIADLGEEWEKLTSSPLPLGGIIGKKSIPSRDIHKINQILYESVKYAFENPRSGKEFVKLYAQETSDDVIQKHINLYVNEFSKELGLKGKKAIRLLFEKAKSYGIITNFDKHLFIEDLTK